MLLRTEAVVVRSMPYGETSRIATLFTLKKGKITAMAKGARAAKSRFGSSLEVLSHIQAVIYHRPSRSMHTLSESSHMTLFNRMTQHLDTLAAAQRVCELTYALTEEEEPQPDMYSLLVRTLKALDLEQTNASCIQMYFQMRLAEALGFAPDFTREDVQALDESGGFLLLDAGTIVAQANPSRSVQRATRSALRAFAILARAELAIVTRMHLTPEQLSETRRLVDDFLRYHVAEAYPTRGEAIFKELGELRPPVD